MPRKPKHWLYLRDALAEFERLETEWIDRATLQEVLGCSQTEAWRILKRLGAEPGPGGALVLSRPVFLERLTAYVSDDRVVFERRRRERLEQALDALNPHTRARLVKVIEEDRPAESLRLMSTRFGHLPPGVTLTASSLHIEFQGREEFLERLGAVVFALQNDTERMLAFLEEREGNTPEWGRRSPTTQVPDA